MSSRTASLLCYIPMVGWVFAIIALASLRFRTDRTVRFHAFQGIYLFVVWLIVDWVVSPVLNFVPGHVFYPHRLAGSVLHLAVFFAWIWMIVKTSQEQTYHLPIVGELAERSLYEQR
ncbi:MAG TPA: hypothetical protein VMZ52_11245 [Bryobacteraceae bacterium]|nr:hypothetical protein [Bryobacteraceae bacterium]